MPEILRASDREARPWKNGGGSTADVFASPADATLDTFDWRVSIATIAADGAFSTFAGVDRFLVPLSAAGLDLETASGVRHLERWQVFEFGGEESITAVGVAATSTDLNLMVRRQTTEGSVEIQRREDGSVWIVLENFDTGDAADLRLYLKEDELLQDADGYWGAAEGGYELLLADPGASRQEIEVPGAWDMPEILTLTVADYTPPDFPALGSVALD